MINLSLNDRQAEILSFILQEVLERWDDEQDHDLDMITSDPTITSVDQLLETTGDLTLMLMTVQEVQQMLATKEPA